MKAVKQNRFPVVLCNMLHDDVCPSISMMTTTSVAAGVCPKVAGEVHLGTAHSATGFAF